MYRQASPISFLFVADPYERTRERGLAREDSRERTRERGLAREDSRERTRERGLAREDSREKHRTLEHVEAEMRNCTDDDRTRGV